MESHGSCIHSSHARSHIVYKHTLYLHATKTHCAHTHTHTHTPQTVILYLLMFRLEELGIGHLKKLLATQHTGKVYKVATCSCTQFYKYSIFTKHIL